jgi:hypothetical protein
VRAQSAKRRQQQKQRRQLANQLGDRPCSLKVPNVCTFWAEAFHELVGAGQGGSRTDPRNISPACHRCNGFCEDQPEIAVRFGWKVPGWDSERTETGRVPIRPNPYSLAEQET